MPKLTLTLETVTPLLMNGANQTPEIRAASFRGAFRYWLRAVLGGVYQNDIEKLREEEAKYFGSTAGASPLRVRVVSKLNAAVDPDNNEHRLGHPILPPRYSFPGYDRNQTFSIKIEGHPFIQKTNIFAPPLYAALLLAFHLGGFGKRARRGSGVLRIIDVDADWNDEQIEQFRQLSVFQPEKSADLQAFLNDILLPYVEYSQSIVTPSSHTHGVWFPSYPTWIAPHVKVLVKSNGLANPAIIPQQRKFIPAHRQVLEELWRLSGDYHHLPDDSAWGYATSRKRRASAVFMRVFRSSKDTYYGLVAMLQSGKNSSEEHWGELQAFDTQLRSNGYIPLDFCKGVVWS